MLRPAARDGRRDRLIVLAVATLGTVALAWRGWLMPYFPNILLDVQCGAARIVLGPLTLRDGCVAADPGLGEMAAAQRAVLTWLGLVGVGSLVMAALRMWIRPSGPAPPGRQRAAIIMIVASGGSYLALVALLVVFDRYVLYAVPLLLVLFTVALLNGPNPRRSFVLGGVLAMSSLAWSAGATQEYLDWNRARWRAIAYLMDGIGAGREEIDGGFEFGGWFNSDSDLHDRKGASWWWVIDDRYSVTFSEVGGYDVLARFPYRGWFGLVEDDVLALRRSEDVEEDRRRNRQRRDRPRRDAWHRRQPRVPAPAPIFHEEWLRILRFCIMES